MERHASCAVATALADRAPAAVLVGYSGGVDSSVLLHALAAQPQQRAVGLRALHVHHGLHRDADRWAAHCRNFCQQLGVTLEIVRVRVEHDAGLGVEGAARAARRAAFAQALQPQEWLALAHHRDDQAETFLLRALRASGPDGLAAIRPLRAFAAGTLWRPLLQLPRAQLLSYALTHALSWTDDPSNAELDYDRNFLRHQVLPLLRQRWPHADAALARSAALSAEASELLAQQDAARLPSLLDDHGALDLQALRGEPEGSRGRLLRLWVARHHAPPLPAQGVAVIQAELACDDADRETCFAWNGVQIRRWRQHLYLLPPAAAWPADWQQQWDGSTALALPDGGCLQLQGTSGFAQPLSIRARRGGERITLPGRRHSHALKHLLQSAAIPPWQRSAMPLLFAGDTLLAAADRIISGALQHWLDSHGACLQWTAGQTVR
jgi:tRNA(Ile)-lysidine synthase